MIKSAVIVVSSFRKPGTLNLLRKVCTAVTDMNGLKLGDVVSRLNSYAHPSLAGSWDNVGLLIEPSSPHVVSKALLTNDLTEAVMKEALEKQVNMILSYHPPIFMPMKRVTQSSWKERIVIKCLENRIAIFSPHTTYDAIPGGVNDWLIKPFPGTSTPLEKVNSRLGRKYRAEFGIAENSVEETRNWLASEEKNLTVIGHNTLEKANSSKTCRMIVTCDDPGLSLLTTFVNGREDVNDLVITSTVKEPKPDTGAGRLLTLETPIPLKQVVEKVKTHLKLSHVRLAIGSGASLEKNMKTMAVCAGSGSGVLKNVSADVYLTGEMSHHEVLDAVHKKRSVILCDHSNTERGFLEEVLKGDLNKLFEEQVEILVSQTDRDPLEVV